MWKTAAVKKMKILDINTSVAIRVSGILVALKEVLQELLCTVVYVGDIHGDEEHV